MNYYNNNTWRALRRNQLAIDPLCRYCKDIGITTVATVADHIEPHKGNMDLMYDPSNLQSLCKTCHDKVKAIEERSGYIIGSDINGNPINPKSHWHKEG